MSSHARQNLASALAVVSLRLVVAVRRPSARSPPVPWIRGSARRTQVKQSRVSGNKTTGQRRSRLDVPESASTVGLGDPCGRAVARLALATREETMMRPIPVCSGLVLICSGLILIGGAFVSSPAFADDDCHFHFNFPLPGDLTCHSKSTDGGMADRCVKQGGTCVASSATSNRTVVCKCEDKPGRPKPKDATVDKCELAVSKELGKLARKRLKCLDTCQKKGLAGTEVDCNPTTNSEVLQCINDATAKAQAKIASKCPGGQPACHGPDLVGQVERVVDALNWGVYCANNCGDNVTDPGEDCDGTDDVACPGLCSVDCYCP